MSSTTEIGSLKQKVTIIDAPTCGQNGQIRHASGENVNIDFKTLQKLEQRARAGPKANSSKVPLDVFYA